MGRGIRWAATSKGSADPVASVRPTVSVGGGRRCLALSRALVQAARPLPGAGTNRGRPAGSRRFDAVRGFQTSLTLQRRVECETCHGAGTKPGSTPTTCPECGGSGSKPVVQGPLQFRVPCPRCQGSGQLPGDPCTACGGTGRIQRAETMRVNIPPGAEAGKRIRLRGKGQAGIRGGPAGDLYIVPRIRPRFAVNRVRRTRPQPTVRCA